MINKICLKYLPTLTTSDQGYQQHLLKSNSEHWHYIFQYVYTNEEKYCTFFGQYSLMDENEISKFLGERGKNTLKSISWQQSKSAESLGHSDVEGIQL